MANLIDVKVHDGVQIKMDPVDGQFQATFGCTCTKQYLKNLGHARGCGQKTVARKALRDLELAIEKAQAPKVPITIKAIQLGYYGGPSTTEIIDVERRERSDRYRLADGDLLKDHVVLYEHDESLLAELRDRYAVVEHAQKRYDESKAKLNRLTRERFRELQREAAAQKTEGEAGRHSD